MFGLCLLPLRETNTKLNTFDLAFTAENGGSHVNRGGSAFFLPSLRPVGHRGGLLPSVSGAFRSGSQGFFGASSGSSSGSSECLGFFSARAARAARTRPFAGRLFVSACLSCMFRMFRVFAFSVLRIPQPFRLPACSAHRHGRAAITSGRSCGRPSGCIPCVS